MTSDRWAGDRDGAAELSRLRGTAPGGGVTTGALLRQLLVSEPAYRRRWRTQVRRASARDPHQSAVAAVLADHLWDIGEVAESDRDLPRRLKDVVARAVSGRGISHQTLGWFVGAFGMSEEHEQALWSQLEADLEGEGRSGTPTVSRRPHPIVPAEHRENPRTAATYRTQSLIERFEVGGDRSRRRHTMQHIIRAQAPMDRVTYRFDTADVAVEVSRGGAPGPLLEDLTPGMFRIEIQLPATLEAGQTTVLETVANYPEGGPVVHHFRRGLRETAGGVSLEVSFDQEVVPRQVRWVELVDARAGVAATEPVRLSPERVVHRFLTPAQDCAVGFEWDW